MTDGKKNEAKSARLQDRDIDLIALIAQVRYVTTDHARRSVTPDRSLSAVRNRLRALSQLERPYIKRLTYTDKRGNRIPVWGLTARGYQVASERLGRLLQVPDSDVGELFLNHDIQVTELAVQIWELGKSAKGVYTSPKQSWIWSSGALLRLPFDVDESNKKNGKRLQPDAVVELPNLRIFVEFESGANGYDDPNKTGSIQNKLQRYWAFFNHKSSYAGQTWYRVAFPDDKPVRLLFVTATEALRSRIFRMVGGSKLFKLGRVRTHSGAVEYLKKKVGEPARVEAPKVISTPIKRESEKVTAADAEVIRDFFNEALVTINQFQRAALEKRVPTDAPKFPKQSIAVRALLAKWEARLKAAPKAPAKVVDLPKQDQVASHPLEQQQRDAARLAALPAPVVQVNPLDRPIRSAPKHHPVVEKVASNLAGSAPAVQRQAIVENVAVKPAAAALLNQLDRPVSSAPQNNDPVRRQPVVQKVAGNLAADVQVNPLDRPVRCLARANQALRTVPEPCKRVAKEKGGRLAQPLRATAK